MSEKDELVERLRLCSRQMREVDTLAHLTLWEAADFIERYTRIEPEAADRGVSEALLLAIREPTAAMLRAGREFSCCGKSKACAYDGWQAMIDAAIQSLRSEHALPPVTNGERK